MSDRIIRTIVGATPAAGVAKVSLPNGAPSVEQGPGPAYPAPKCRPVAESAPASALPILDGPRPPS